MGLRSKQTGPLGGMGSEHLLILCRIIPPVKVGMAIGTAGRMFGVAKAFLAGSMAGPTFWFFAAAAGFALSARFASRGFSTSVTFRQHLSTGFFLPSLSSFSALSGGKSSFL